MLIDECAVFFQHMTQLCMLSIALSVVPRPWTQTSQLAPLYEIVNSYC